MKIFYKREEREEDSIVTEVNKSELPVLKPTENVQALQPSQVDPIPIDEFSRSLLETFRAKKTLASVLIHETRPIEKLRLAHQDKKFVYISRD